MYVNPDSLQHIPHDLVPGEWQLFCESCGYKADKNVAMNPKCPNCGLRLFIAEEKEQS